MLQDRWGCCLLRDLYIVYKNTMVSDNEITSKHHRKKQSISPHKRSGRPRCSPTRKCRWSVRRHTAKRHNRRHRNLLQQHSWQRLYMSCRRCLPGVGSIATLIHGFLNLFSSQKLKRIVFAPELNMAIGSCILDRHRVLLCLSSLGNGLITLWAGFVKTLEITEAKKDHIKRGRSLLILQTWNSGLPDGLRPYVQFVTNVPEASKICGKRSVPGTFPGSGGSTAETTRRYGDAGYWYRE